MIENKQFFCFFTMMIIKREENIFLEIILIHGLRNCNSCTGKNKNSAELFHRSKGTPQQKGNSRNETAETKQ